MPLMLLRGRRDRSHAPAVPHGAGDAELTDAYLRFFEREARWPGRRAETDLIGTDAGIDAARSLRAAVRAASIYLASNDASITVFVPEGEPETLRLPELSRYIAERYTGGENLFGAPFTRAAGPKIAPGEVSFGITEITAERDIYAEPEEQSERDTSTTPESETDLYISRPPEDGSTPGPAAPQSTAGFSVGTKSGRAGGPGSVSEPDSITRPDDHTGLFTAYPPEDRSGPGPAAPQNATGFSIGSKRKRSGNADVAGTASAVPPRTSAHTQKPTHGHDAEDDRTSIRTHGTKYTSAAGKKPDMPYTPGIAPATWSSSLHLAAVPEPAKKAESLEDMLKRTDAGFSETLLRLINESGRKDSEVYRSANIDRKLFSKIRSNPSYRPSKSTALALAFALRLDLDGARDLIGRAGYTLTHASCADIIVEYFIVNGNYDIFELNETLFRYDQPLLGGA